MKVNSNLRRYSLLLILFVGFAAVYLFFGNKQASSLLTGTTTSSPITSSPTISKTQHTDTNDPFVVTAKEFVDLISTYRPEWAEKQFGQAKAYLSASGLSEFISQMMGPELRAIEKSKRSQMFFARVEQIQSEPIPGRDLVLVRIPGVRQRLLSGKPLALEKLEYNIEMGRNQGGLHTERDIVIQRFNYRRISDKEYSKPREPENRSLDKELKTQIPIAQIPSDTFPVFAKEFVNLVGNFQPSIAESRFLAARKYLNLPAREQLQRSLIDLELAAIKKYRRSQLFFVDPELVRTEIIVPENKVVVSLSGIRQKFIGSYPLPIDKVTYRLSITTSSGRVFNPWGIVISNIDLIRPHQGENGSKVTTTLEAKSLKSIKTELQEYYLEGKEKDKENRKAQIKKLTIERRERREGLRLTNVFRYHISPYAWRAPQSYSFPSTEDSAETNTHETQNPNLPLVQDCGRLLCPSFSKDF